MRDTWITRRPENAYIVIFKPGVYVNGDSDQEYQRFRLPQWRWTPDGWFEDWSWLRNGFLKPGGEKLPLWEDTYGGSDTFHDSHPGG